jgi:Mrp family chromosome partitioning ATPase
MENIRQAVERARTGRDPQSFAEPPGWTQPRSEMNGAYELELRPSYLESKRVVAHDGADPRAKPYDMLRTQVLRSMDLKGWKVLAVTSPTPACGKTQTAVNLALSIGRQPERSVLLIDMDIQKGQVAKNLGIRFEEGLLSVLEGTLPLSSAIIDAYAGKSQFMVLPTEITSAGSSEWMACRAMEELFQEIRRAHQSRIVIVDLPPMLYSDDVLTVLPQMDCVLLVAAVGTSTIAEIQECNKYLQSSEVLRLVLNKVQEPTSDYYYY